MNVDSELWQDVNVVASLLKLFLRKLPRSLLTPGLYTLLSFLCFIISISSLSLL